MSVPLDTVAEAPAPAEATDAVAILSSLPRTVIETPRSVSAGAFHTALERWAAEGVNGLLHLRHQDGEGVCLWRAGQIERAFYHGPDGRSEYDAEACVAMAPRPGEPGLAVAIHPLDARSSATLRGLFDEPIQRKTLEQPLEEFKRALQDMAAAGQPTLMRVDAGNQWACLALDGNGPVGAYDHADGRPRPDLRAIAKLLAADDVQLTIYRPEPRLRPGLKFPPLVEVPKPKPPEGDAALTSEFMFLLSGMDRTLMAAENKLKGPADVIRLLAGFVNEAAQLKVNFYQRRGTSEWPAGGGLPHVLRPALAATGRRGWSVGLPLTAEGLDAKALAKNYREAAGLGQIGAFYDDLTTTFLAALTEVLGWAATAVGGAVDDNPYSGAVNEWLDKVRAVTSKNAPPSDS